VKSRNRAALLPANLPSDDITPTLPALPASDDGCGVHGQITAIAIIALVTYLATQFAGGLATSLFGATASGFAFDFTARAIAGAAGSVVGQGAAIAMGMHDEFSWKPHRKSDRLSGSYAG
jgi:hypothetical protein